MFRFICPLSLLLVAQLQAQFIIRTPGPVGGGFRPNIIPQPMMPIPGISSPPRLNALPSTGYLNIQPLGIYSGIWPFYPTWNPPTNTQNIINNNYFSAPVPANPVLPPPEKIETKARVILFVPRSAEVIVNGQKQDTRSRPIVVESPDLREGQRHTFDLKITWKEGDLTEERTRQITVERGDEKSLIYNAGK